MLAIKIVFFEISKQQISFIIKQSLSTYVSKIKPNLIEKKIQFL